MPTQNPRVNVTLSPTTDALVGRMARLQRVSKSQVLRELLEAAEPALQRAATLMEAAAEARDAVKANLGRDLDRAQAQAERAMAKMTANLDSLTVDLVGLAEAVRSRRPARGAEVAPQARAPRPSASRNPPASNRGVKSTDTGGKPSAKRSGGRS